MLFNHWAERLNLVYHALFSNLCSRMLWLVDAYFTQKLCSFTNVLLAVFSSVLMHHLCLFTKLVILNPRSLSNSWYINRRNNYQHCWPEKCWEFLDSVGRGVQTDATTPNDVGTCSALFHNQNSSDNIVTHVIDVQGDCVIRVRGPNNVGRAAQIDSTLLRYALAITEKN